MSFKYEVREQWPSYSIACFISLEDAAEFIRTDGHRFALPIVISHVSIQDEVVRDREWKMKA